MQIDPPVFYVAVDDSVVRAALMGLIVILALIGWWCLRKQEN